MSTYTPVIRDDLSISEQDNGDETAYIIKDPRTDNFYRFKAPEYFIVKQLNGKNSLEDINRNVEREFDAPLPEETLKFFITSLYKRGLLKPHEQAQDSGLEVVSKKETPQGVYVYVKHPNGKVYRFREIDHFIVEQLHLLVPPETIRQKIIEQFGQDMPVSRIIKITNNLLKRGLAVETPDQAVESNQSAKRIRGNLLYLRFPLFDPDKTLERLAYKLDFFFTRGFVIFSAAMIAAAIFMLLSNGGQLVNSASSLFQINTLMLIWMLIVPITILHEMAHGLTCKHFGGRVRETGFLLIFFQPALYCNVSDAWLFKERYKRLWVGLAGVYFELFLWAVAVMTWRITAPETWVHYLALVLMGTSGFRITLNLVPLIKLDGYYVLSDYLQMPNLRGKAFSYIANDIKAAFGYIKTNPNKALPARERRIYLGYGLVAGGFTLLLLTYIFTQVAGFLVDQYQGTGFVIFSSLLLTVFGYPMYLRVSKNASGKSTKPAQQQNASNPGPLTPFQKFYKRSLYLLFFGSLFAYSFVGEMDLKVSGEFTVFANNNADIRTEVSGIIEEIYIDQGDTIKTGDTIATLSDRDHRAEIRKVGAEITEKKAKLEKYQEQLKYAVKRRKNYTRLKKHNAIPKDKIDDANREVAITQKSIKEIKAELDRLDVQKNHLNDQLGLFTITSPIDGVVATPNAMEKSGQFIQQGDQLIEIHQIQKVKVEILVPEKEIGDVEVGQDILLKARAYPGRTFDGKVMKISPIVENLDEHNATKVIKVVSEIDNQDLLLKKDMTGHAKILAGQRKIIELITRRVTQYIKVEFWSWW